jgi:peptidyl-tRNA hydrolase
VRLYLVTRRDLPAGSQAVQACHAARQFAADHAELERAWFERSNTLALLAVPDEPALEDLVVQAEQQGLRCARFREPDLGDALTAVAIEPGDVARRLCRRLPLALS